MTYNQILDRQPHSNAAGNTAVAAEYVVFLTTQIEGQTLAGLSESQKSYIYRLRDKWSRRAKGLDVRWNAGAARPGRPAKKTGGDSRRHRALRDDPSEQTPLFKSLMSKYGTPIEEDP